MKTAIMYHQLMNTKVKVNKAGMNNRTTVARKTKHIKKTKKKKKVRNYPQTIKQYNNHINPCASGSGGQCAIW